MGDLSTPPTPPPTPRSTTPQGVGDSERVVADADLTSANMGSQGLLPGAEIIATPELTWRNARAIAEDLEQVQKGRHILKAICVFLKNLFSKGEKITVQKEIAREWHEKNKEQMAGNLEIMANPAVLASLEVGHPRKYAEMLQTIDGLLSTNYAVAFLRKTSATIHSIMDNAASGTEMELEDSQWDALLANAYGICDQASSSSATLFNPASTLGSVIEFREQHPDNRIPVGDLLVLANEASSMLANEASSTSPSLARIIEERGEVPAPLRTPGVIAQIARAGISLRDTPFQNEFEILNFMARCKNVGDPTALVQACIDNFKNRRGLEFRKLANIASPHRGAMDDIEMSDDVIVLCLTGGDERNVAAAVALAEAGIPANAITGDVVTKVAEKGMQTLRGSDSIQETEGFKCLKRAMIRCGTPDMKLALVRAYIVKPDDMKTLDSAVDRYETPEARQALVEFFLTDMDHCLSLCRYSENIDAGKPTERLISLCAANPGPICNAIYDLCSSKQIPEGIVTTDLIKEYCAHKTIFDEDVKAIMDRCNDLEMNKGLIGLFCTDPDKCTELRKLMNDGLSHETIVWLVNRNNRTECIGIASKLRELGVGCDLITQKLIEPASAHPKEFEELAK
ncbi:MAG: hypothetical protein LBD33_03220, partial [Puniceicoccales bacterium]|nr:hypothetical protein [Puniceicoccales bacterium]